MNSRALITSPIIFVLTTIGYIIVNNVLTLPINANYVTYTYLALNFILSFSLMIGYKPAENFVNKLQSKFEHFTNNKLAGKGNYVWLFIIIVYVAVFLYTTMSTSSIANQLDVVGLNFEDSIGLQQVIIMVHTTNIVLAILNNIKAISG
jgi:magnesium-transporting ATPase (P-type)